MKINANLFLFLNWQDLLSEIYIVENLNGKWKQYLSLLKANWKHYGYNKEWVIL